MHIAPNRLPALVALLLTLACSSVPEADASPMAREAGVDASSTDAGLDAARPADGGSALDAGTPADGAAPVDGGRDAEARADASGADAGGADAGGADAGGTDAGGTDAGGADAGPSIELGEVACRRRDDCGSGLTCDLDAPGGRCQGCMGASSCAAGYTCSFGTCLLECSGDGDCNLGMRCAAFDGSRYCRPRTCAACPAPYVCRSGACSRPLCDEGGVCPAPLVCAGTHCVEP